jgi:sucrose-6-phosphate hydrolase SacC (GH32 family)
MPSQPEQVLHYGDDAYAGQSFSNLENGRIVRIVWHRNWKFDTKTFAGQMGFPTSLSLCEYNGKYYIGANPINEIEKLYLKNDCYNNLSITPESEFDYKLENSPYLIKVKTKIDKFLNVYLY